MDPAPPFDPGDAANALAEILAGLREVLAPIDEATLGYRRQLEGQGWSPAAAEKMALSFHTMLTAQIQAGMKL